MNNRGYRWYVLQRVSPGYPVVPVRGAVYGFVSWTKVRETARAHCDKLDQKGRQGIMVYSASRRQAVTDLRAIYGVSVQGYDSKGAVIQ